MCFVIMSRDYFAGKKCVTGFREVQQMVRAAFDAVEISKLINITSALVTKPFED